MVVFMGDRRNRFVWFGDRISRSGSRNVRADY